MGIVQAGAYFDSIRAESSTATSRRRVRFAGATAADSAPARAAADAPREPQRQGRRPQAAVVGLRRRRRLPASQETLSSLDIVRTL